MKINPTKTVNELISALSYIVDLEKGKNVYHAWRVAILSAHISGNKTRPEELRNIFYAGLLHDIGAAGLNSHIIHYLIRDNKTDRYILLSHPIVSAQLTANIPRLGSAAKLILDHHEWINGQGYPRAKIEEEIAFGSKVIRLADSIDIALHGDHIRNLKDLKDKISTNVNKEYSEILFKKAAAALKQDNLFARINSPADIAELFKETKAKVGAIRIPNKIDAIGTTLEVVSQIIDMKHPYNAGHSLRVSRYAMAIAMAMNLPHDEITRIKWAGLIHDIGKFTVSRFIMNKPSTLTPEEYQEVKKHAQTTYDMLEMIPTLKEIAPVASSHHEYFDGSGYPQGLKGKQIPLGSRILVACDAFDAMTSNRPYRQPLTPQEACREIRNLSGKQFDPAIAKIAQPLFKNLGL